MREKIFPKSSLGLKIAQHFKLKKIYNDSTRLSEDLRLLPQPDI